MAVRIKCDSSCEESEAKLRCCMPRTSCCYVTKIRAEKRAAFAPYSDRRSSSGFHLLLHASDDQLAATTFPQALAFENFRRHLLCGSTCFEQAL